MSVKENFKTRIKTLKEIITPLHAVVFSLSAFIITCSALVYQYKRAERYSTALNNHYLACVSDLSVYMDNIKYNLAKGMLATDGSEIIKIADEISSDTAFAVSALCSLPSYGSAHAKTAEFLSKLGDYTKSLSVSFENSRKLSQNEYDTLESFMTWAEKVSGSAKRISEDIFGRKINLCDIETLPARESAEISSALRETEGYSENLPKLIYNGPFSDHVKENESALLKGKPEISKKEAEAEVLKLLGGNFSGNIEYMGETRGSLPTYNFSVKKNEKDTRSITVEITKKGGAISLILDNRIAKTPALSLEDAKKNAYSFLNRYPFGKMQDTYYETENGNAVINFAFCQGDVICYGDLVKVKVSLDSGEIAGLECSGYISNHKERTLPSFSHSEEEIKNKISPRAESLKIQKCVIPTKDGGEKFCYEVLCKYKDKKFLVYLNEENLRQEEILLLITTENAMLPL